MCVIIPNINGGEYECPENIAIILRHDKRSRKFEIPGGKPKEEDKDEALNTATRESMEEAGYKPQALDYKTSTYLMAFGLHGKPIYGDPNLYEGDVTYMFIHQSVSGMATPYKPWENAKKGQKNTGVHRVSELKEMGSNWVRAEAMQVITGMLDLNPFVRVDGELRFKDELLELKKAPEKYPTPPEEPIIDHYMHSDEYPDSAEDRPKKKMCDEEKRYQHGEADDNGVSRTKFRKFKLWIRVLEYMVEELGGNVGTSLLLPEAAEALARIDPKGDCLYWSKSRKQAELYFDSLKKGPPKGFTELRLDENSANHKKDLIVLTERFVGGLVRDKETKLEVREQIYRRVCEDGGDLPMPMGIGLPNRLRFPRISDSDIPQCAAVGRVPPY